MKKSAATGGVVAAVAAAPGTAIAQAISNNGLTHDPKEAPKLPETVKPAPKLKSQLKGIDLTTPRSLGDEVARDLLKKTDWGREAPKVTASIILREGDELKIVRVPLEVDWEATREQLASGQSWAGWKFKNTSWDADKAVDAVGVYVRWHDVNDYTVAHFVQSPALNPGNMLTVNYTMMN